MELLFSNFVTFCSSLAPRLRELGRVAPGASGGSPELRSINLILIHFHPGQHLEFDVLRKCWYLSGPTIHGTTMKRRHGLDGEMDPRGIGIVLE